MENVRAGEEFSSSGRNFLSSAVKASPKIILFYFQEVYPKRIFQKKFILQKIIVGFQ